jgi:hypothetical protein
MKTTKDKTVKVLDRIYCDVCGQSCTKGDEDNGWTDHEYAIIEATWGYFSHQDGTQYNIEICEHCFNEVLECMKKIRKRILGPNKYPYDSDPLEGKDYLPS